MDGGGRGWCARLHQASSGIPKILRVEWNGCAPMACTVTSPQPYRGIIRRHRGRVKLDLGKGERFGGTRSSEGCMGFYFRGAAGRVSQKHAFPAEGCLFVIS